ncbi:MAG: hypothetical protein HOK02_01810 [Halieaceae bacterium]|nr:hypothetical protein [Halieaceae bacterium]
MTRLFVRCHRVANIVVLITALITVLTLTTNAAMAARLPGGFAHSGWFQFELVVLVDTRPAVLNSETWPLTTSVHYPARWRWIQDPALKAALMTQYDSATVSVSPSGHVLVTPPSAAPPVWEPPPPLLTEPEIAMIDELMALRLPTPPEPDITETTAADELLSLANEDKRQGPLLPFEDAGLVDDTPRLTPFESLGITGDVLRGQAPEISIPLALPVEEVTLTPLTVTARRIPQPATFEKLPLDRLAAGLERYQQQNDDAVLVATSWLQSPDSDSLPILVEPDTDSPYPVLQGFIQLLPRDNSWRLGVNLWANTDGQYLPSIFEGAAPPPSPQRVTVLSAQASLDPALTHPASIDADNGPPAQVSVPLSPIDTDSSPATLMNEPGLPAQPLTGPVPPTLAPWPWRHVIHIEDTVPLSENRLRYYDHPVVKILATWRELSWYELYALGETIDQE